MVQIKRDGSPGQQATPLSTLLEVHLGSPGIAGEQRETLHALLKENRDLSPSDIRDAALLPALMHRNFYSSFVKDCDVETRKAIGSLPLVEIGRETSNLRFGRHFEWVIDDEEARQTLTREQIDYLSFIKELGFRKKIAVLSFSDVSVSPDSLTEGGFMLAAIASECHQSPPHILSATTRHKDVYWYLLQDNNVIPTLDKLPVDERIKFIESALPDSFSQAAESIISPKTALLALADRTGINYVSLDERTVLFLLKDRSNSFKEDGLLVSVGGHPGSLTLNMERVRGNKF